MSRNTPTLHLLCGKIAAGKSTLAHRLAEEPQTVLLSEDVLLAHLYPGELQSLQDYVTYSARLRDALGPHVEQLLQSSLSVVLDFSANTLGQRRWMCGLLDNVNAAHVLHFLDVADDVCKARLRQRNATGAHPFAPSEADFDVITEYFVPPSAEEGFTVQVYGEEG